MKHLPDNTDTTMFKSFSGWNDFANKVKGYRLFVELSNMYFIPTSRAHLKRVANTMIKNNEPFTGSIVFTCGQKIVQVAIKSSLKP